MGARNRLGREQPRSDSRLAQAAESLVRNALGRPRSAIVLGLLLAILAGLGVARLRIETSTESVLDHRGEPWRFYRATLDRFGGDEIVVVALEGREPWDPELLAALPRLTRELEQLPGVRRVDSLASVPLVRVTEEGELDLDPVLADVQSPGSIDPRVVAERVAHDRIAPRTLASDDGRTLALTVWLVKDPPAGYAPIVDGIERLVEGYRNSISGVPVFRTATDARTAREVVLFVPLTVLLLAAILWLAFRSARAVVIPLLTSTLGTWCVLGAMGATGVPLTITTLILPSVLLAIGCAYIMHLLTAAAGRAGPAELRAALEPVALPIAISGITTAIGFAAMATVGIEAIRDVGAFGAFGVAVVLLASLTLVPALLRLRPLPRRPTGFTRWLERRGRKLVLRLSQPSGRVIGIWLLVCLVFGLGIRSLRVESDVTLWFPPGTPVRDGYERIRHELSGISPMDVVIESVDGDPVTSPRALRAIDALERHLAALPEVGKVVSIADPLREVHGGFLDDASQPLPDRLDLAEQYLLLLESVDSIHDLVTDDRQAANVLLRLNENGSLRLLSVAREAERWWSRHGPAGFRARTTGIMHEFARSEHEIAWGQIRGLATALVVISALLLAIFRSPTLAGLALLPNAIPVALAFGVMGLAGVPLDAGTVLVGNLALGIAVDDTVHVVTAFRREAGRGREAPQALAEALRGVLPPVVTTSLAIGFAFAVLGVSDFTFIRNLGVLTFAIMGVCLLADLNLLPALLRVWGATQRGALSASTAGEIRPSSSGP